ncbi:MAG: dephospho-CoA kinase [Chloroflexi bacterium]|nr:dephospho-CoA kinase [Chloroflexota bacterium]
MAFVLGITGSIACGKSLLCQHLVEAYGARHIDADRHVHTMYEPGKPAFDRIVAQFGNTVVGTDGFIDRKALGDIVFGKPDLLAALRTAIGDIEGEFMRLLRELKDDPAPIAVFEAVRLFEGPYMEVCDAGWLVASEDETALTRLMSRKNFSREEAEQRMASAIHWTERAPKADLVLHNDSSVEEFLASVDDAIASALKDHQ